MPMKTGFQDCLREAFNAKPLGMFIPPNWVGLAAFGLLGFLNPGFWLIGAGLESAYLFMLSTNERFQRYVAGTGQLQARQQWQRKIEEYVGQLSPDGQRRYHALERKFQEILEQQSRGAALPAPGLEAQGEGLGRLLWVYLKLLVTRQAIDRLISTTVQEDAERIQERIQNLQTRLKEAGLGEELRKSLTGQIEILQQRVEKRREARDKLAFLDAELVRIQEQAELIHEQAVLSTDPEGVSQRIDQITTTLDGTAQWIKEQQKVYGVVEDLLVDPPMLSAGTQGKLSQ
jgi:hypothetical protein